MRYSFNFCVLLLLASSIAYSEQFFVKLPNGKTKTVEMSLEDDVEALHERLSSITKLPKKLIYLTFNARVLDPRKNQQLKEYGLKRGDTIFAIIKTLCCVRCYPKDAIAYVLETIVYCIGSTFFTGHGALQQDLCECDELATEDH